jgi:hypothetical protein
MTKSIGGGVVVATGVAALGEPAVEELNVELRVEVSVEVSEDEEVKVAVESPATSESDFFSNGL